MKHVLSHFFEQRACAFNCILFAAYDKGQRGCSRARCAARNRGVEHGKALGHRRAGDFLGDLGVDGTAVDEKSACLGVLDDPFGAEIDFFRVLCRRQHGQDDIGVLHRFGDARGGFGAFLRQCPDSFVDEVENGKRESPLEQVFRHGRTHVPKPDKGDLRHGEGSSKVI